MSDTTRHLDATLSASTSHDDPEPLEASQSVHHTEETHVQTREEENTLEQRSFGSEMSHKSEEEEDDGWMVTPLVGRQDVRISSEEMTEEDEADVEASVREALRLLEDSIDGGDEGESEGEQERDQWKAGMAETVYLDFVHEVMEDRWTLDDIDGQHNGHWRTPEEQVDSEEEEIQEDNNEETVGEDNEEHNGDTLDHQEREQEQQDEWQEAYTAKGRVYYYNRRTRESSWKKPSHYNPSSNQPQPSAAATEEESVLHRSVLRQSLGYRPSASPSASPISRIERQATLYCNFCGEQQPSDQLASHFQECASAKFHKRRLSPLYLSFERALGIMSEDSTLRSLHYASSFPDPTPHGRPEATSMQDSLLLLRPRRRHSSVKDTDSTPQKLRTSQSRVFGTAENGLKVSPTKQEATDAPPSQTTDAESSKRKKKSVKKKNSQATSTFPVKQSMETCRYCNRSFAEGRLAKHEAVCPRVFGNEGSWGRGTPSSQTSPSKPKSTRVGTPPSSVGSVALKLHKLKDHTLQQSYKEHQATLVLCPCCHRKFAPSGAQQHIAICKGVQNRPKNPIPLLRDYAMAG